MAISRGSMPKELVGNRVKKKAGGGMLNAGNPPPGPAMGSRIAPMPMPMGAAKSAPPPGPAMGGRIAPMPAPMGAMKPGMKAGGTVRGSGCAKRGTKGGKMV